MTLGSITREAYEVRAARRFAVSVLLLVLSCTLTANAKDLFVSLSGNDTNPGSNEHPFRTIQKAANSVQPGVTVHIAPGFYEENVRVTASGKPDQPITFKAAPGARNKGFVIQGSHITVDGFDIGFGPVAKREAAIRILPLAHYTWIINNHIHHLTNSYGIDMETDAKLPEQGPANCVISNNFFEYIGHINVNLFGSNNLVIGNAFANSFNEGDAVRAWGANHHIVANVMTNMGLGSATETRGHPDLIQTFGDWGVSAYGIVFERNYCADSLSQICQLEQKGVTDIRDWTFRNNIFVRISYAANCDIPGVWWCNNLFYQCTTNTGEVILFAAPNNKKGPAWHSGAKNNIFLECSSRPTSPQFGWYDAPAGLDLQCDYNYVAGRNFSAKKSSPTPHSTWSFVEPHGINGGDPGFVSVTSRDFHLKPNSILVGKAQPLDKFNSDFFGNPRPVKWSIGPLEAAQ